MNHLKALNEKIKKNKKELDDWIRHQTSEVLVPLYTSVDVRVSDYKIAPVDTNVFPAGFNNLSQIFRDRASKLFRDYFERKYPKVRNILIIPELHTRNTYYWENILTIKTILEKEGYKVDIGVISEDLEQDRISFEAAGGGSVDAYKATRSGHKVVTSAGTPDLLLINNDFSEKCPKTLHDIIQPVEPPVEIGWHTRKKNVHFEFYNKLAEEACSIIGLDPWTVSIDTVSLNGINFDNPDDRGKAAELADSVLLKLKEEYRRRGVSYEPYLFIKSNSGTYGMAVLSVSNGDDIRSLNSEKRKRMRVNKGGDPVRDIVIQEGIPTSLRLDSGATAEPVFYLVDARTAGGFLRLNKGKSELENLNTRGMEFAHMYCPGENIENVDEKLLCSEAYEFISCVASIAAGYEIEKILKEGGCKEEVA